MYRLSASEKVWMGEITPWKCADACKDRAEGDMRVLIWCEMYKVFWEGVDFRSGGTARA